MLSRLQVYCNELEHGTTNIEPNRNTVPSQMHVLGYGQNPAQGDRSGGGNLRSEIGTYFCCSPI